MTSKKDGAWRTQNVGAALSSASAVFERAVLRTIREGEFGWLSQVQLALFRNLDLNGTHLTELASRARMTKQSMQELVDKAEAFGVVERRPSLQDRRIKIVAFTPDGLRMLDQFRRGVAESEKRMAEVLGDAFLADLKTRLQVYVQAIEPAVPVRTDTGAVARSRTARPVQGVERASAMTAPAYATASRPRRTRTTTATTSGRG